jgi:hypothetical protein
MLAGGVVMNINGTGFSPTALTVAIGGIQSSSVTYNGPNLLTAAIPAGTSVGAANVVVLNGGIPTASLPLGYFYNFGDVPTSHPRQPGVAALHRNGVTAGCTPPNFCPSDDLLRNQAAVFLLRAKEGRAYLPPPGIGWFTDMTNDPTRDWAEDLFNRGVTAGCGTRLYCPGGSMTRAQFSVFLLKLKEGRCYVPPAPGGVFSDTSGNALAAWADEIGRRGAPGCGGTNFCPDQFVNRGDAAAMIRVIFNLS